MRWWSSKKQLDMGRELDFKAFSAWRSSFSSVSGERGALWAVRVLVLGCCLLSGTLWAEADTLERGDLSLGLYQSIAPYNRFWYHFDGDTDCNGAPCSRLNLNSYESINVPTIGGVDATMEGSLLATTGFRVEFGVFERLTAWSEFQLAYTSQVESAVSLGDTWLGARWRASGESALVVSFSGALKVPGTYSPNSLAAPGGGQTDIELKALFGGLALRRKFSYDIGVGYRIRTPYTSTGFVTITPITYASDTDMVGIQASSFAQQWAITGPADEVFLDFALGFYATRRAFVFVNGNLVNSVNGYHVDDYYLLVSQMEQSDTLGRNSYDVSGDPTAILSSLEEDFVRLGGGLLFKVFDSATVYFNYSMSVLGQNTPAFFVAEGSRFPIGTFVVGVDYTFGTRKFMDTETLVRNRDLPDSVLSMKLSPP